MIQRKGWRYWQAERRKRLARCGAVALMPESDDAVLALDDDCFALDDDCPSLSWDDDCLALDDDCPMLD